MLKASAQDRKARGGRLVWWVVSVLSTISAFGVGALIGGPYFGIIHGPVLALFVGRAVHRRFRDRARPRELPTWVAPLTLELVAVGVTLFATTRLWTDERATFAIGLTLVLAAVVSLVPSALRLLVLSSRAWVGDLCIGGVLVVCAIGSYPIGGLWYLVPAFLLGLAAGTEVLHSHHPRRSFTDPGRFELTEEVVRGEIPRWDFEQKLVVAVAGTNVTLALVIGLGRLIMAPAGPNELVGDLGFIAAHALPGVLAWWSVRRGRLSLLLAAGLTAFVQSGQGWWLWLSFLDIDVAPGTLGFVFVLPAVGYLVAYGRQRRAGAPRPSIVPSVAAGVPGQAAAMSLAVIGDWGCGPNGCTNDFMSTAEGSAALVLTVAALALTKVAVGLTSKPAMIDP